MTDDIRKELEAALPHWVCATQQFMPGGDCDCGASRQRSAVEPLIERLVAECDKALAEICKLNGGDGLDK